MADTATQPFTLNGRILGGVCIDFWATIGKDTRVRQRRELRRDLLRAWFAEHDVAMGDDTVYDLLQEYAKHWRNAWLNGQFTPGARDAVNWLADQVGIDPDEESRQAMADRIDDTLRDFPPEPVEGALDAIRELSRHFPLALVCDTGLSGSRNITWLLEQYGVRDLFTELVFSDQVGRSKPHRAMFEAAEKALGVPRNRLVHIGDRDDTDIKGAKSIGMAAIRFDGAKETAECGPCSMADRVVDTWQDVLDAILGDDD